MSPMEAELAVKHIGELFPNVRPAYVDAMFQAFIRPAFSLARVKSVANEMRSRDRMFNLDELVSIIDPPKQDHFIAPGQSAWRQSCEDADRQHAQNERDVAEVAALEDVDLIRLKAEVLARLPGHIRPMYEKRDPRKSKSLALEIAAYVRRTAGAA